MAAQIFISHSSKDVAAARALKQALADAGMSSFIAPDDIAGGLPWAEQISNALRDCSAVIVLLSRESNASDHVAREVSIAVGAHKAVVPVRLVNLQPAGSLQYLLQLIQWVDAFPGPISRYLDAIVVRASSALGDLSGDPGIPVRSRTRPSTKAYPSLGGRMGMIGVVVAVVVVVVGGAFVLWPQVGLTPAPSPTGPRTAGSVGPSPSATVIATQSQASSPTTTAIPSASASPSLSSGPTPSPALAALTGRLAYVSIDTDSATRDLLVKTYVDGVVMASTSVSTNLDNDPNLHWSADGTALLFEQHAGPAIWSCGTTDPIPVELPARPGNPTDPAWGATTDQLLITADLVLPNHNDTTGVYVTTRGDGGWGPPGLISGDFARAGDPSWGPDGRVAIAAQASGAPTTDIYVLSSAGGVWTSTRWTVDGGSDPEWSPDGAWIIYHRGQESDGTIEAISGRDARSGRTTLIGGLSFAKDATWSSAGDQVFLSTLNGGRDQIGRFRFEVPPDPHTPTQAPTPVSPENTASHEDSPAWSDGPTPASCLANQG